MILKAFLDFLYLLLKQLVLLYQRIYYPFTIVRNRDRLSQPGGSILVSNHPNTLTDPLHVASRSRRQVFFLANAGMFKHPVSNFIFNQLYCIPVSRPGKDTDAPRISLAESFGRSFDHLAKGKVMFIAPEGGSLLERHLRKIKTGTARIALGAEAQHNFQLGITIIPTGLNYEYPKYCGSRLFINVGEPIRVSDWQEAYAQNEKAAVLDLTETIATRLRELMLDTADEAQDKLLYRLERIWQNDAPLPVDAHYLRTRTLLAELKALNTANHDDYQVLQTEAAAYAGQLRTHKLTDRGISQARQSLWTPITLLGFPFWLYGRLNNLFVYELPRWLERKLDLYEGYAATVKAVSGLVLTPIFYTIQYQLAKLWLPQPWPWLYLLSLPVSAWLAWQYARYVQPRREAAHWRKWSKMYPEEATQIETQRQVLKGKLLAFKAY